MTTDEFLEAMRPIAYYESQPFCYGCYVVCPKGKCEKCGSDDLMRHVEGVGVEWGVEWVIDHLIKVNLNPIDEDEVFEEFVSACYGETTTVGWMELDTCSVMKDQDPISWRIAKSEHFDKEVEDGILVEINNDYYSSDELEEFIDGYDIEYDEEEE